MRICILGCLQPENNLNPLACIMLTSLCNINSDFTAVIKCATCICENIEADQLRGNHEADQRLSFRYLDSTIPLLPKKFQVSSHIQ